MSGMVAAVALFLLMPALQQSPHEGRIAGDVQAEDQNVIKSAEVTIRFSRPDGLCACKWPMQTLRVPPDGSFGQTVPAFGYFEVCATAPRHSRKCTTVHVSNGETVPVTLRLVRSH